MSDPLATHHQLHGVQPVLPVVDLTQAVRYFVDVLGFELDFVVGDPLRHGRVKIGDGTFGQPIYIHLRSGSEEEVAARPSAELRIHVGHDVDGLCSIYRRRGANIAQEPQSQPWGLREFVVVEPNGHRLWFCAEV